VLRAVSYPDFPDSLLALDVEVTATDNAAWETSIVLHGTYGGPTDVVATHDYQLTWLVDGSRVLESGLNTLESSSGERIRQRWTSIITPGGSSQERSRAIENFPASGEAITATISPFTVDGNRMSYDWEGTVTKQAK
jgi:hypothetical protein